MYFKTLKIQLNNHKNIHTTFVIINEKFALPANSISIIIKKKYIF